MKDESHLNQEHLIVLPGQQWALWKWAGLRAAGFPIDQVMELSMGECSSAADRLIQVEDEAERLWTDAVEALECSISETAPNDRAPLIRVLRKLREGKIPKILGSHCAAGQALGEFADANLRVDASWAEFERSFEKAGVETFEVVRQIAGSRRFREAVIWQNRSVLHTAVDHVLCQSGHSSLNNRSRRGIELVANYWQRYCAKNDTIGFFGPVGWARIVSKPIVVRVRPGPELLAARTVYFEQWGIEELIQVISREEDIKPWIAPRRLPNLCLRGSILYQPFKERVALSPTEVALLHACDGRRLARQIAHDLLSDPLLGLRDDGDVYRLLKDLEARGFIIWKFVIPQSLAPEESLRALLERIGDESLRARSLGKLDQLDSARQAVARAAGDVDSLDHAFDLLESTFTGLTGMAPTRFEGKTYAGRTLVYEDCRRNIEMEIGRVALESLSAPLSLLLTSARWLTFRIAAESRQVFNEIYQELVCESGSRSVSSYDFWARAQHWLYGEGGAGAKIEVEFHRRWAEILSLPPDERAVTYSSEDIRSLVLRLFDAPSLGWNYARYHSPDLMIAASSIEAIDRRDFLIVLGELHLALHTLSRSLFVCQHPSPEELYEALEADLQEPRVIPSLPKGVRASRGALALFSPKDFFLELEANSPSPSPTRALPIGSLVVEESPHGLIARSLDSDLHFDIMEIFADLHTSQVMNSFNILPPCAHSPRLVIDRLVISRESWRFSPAELEFAFEKEDSRRFLGARRWMKENKLPRFVFYKSPIEVKPCFLDFQSPIYVNLFAKMARRAQKAWQINSAKAPWITVTEMLPAPDQSWLPDADGQRYTSELRLIAVDLTNFGPTKNADVMRS